MCRERSCIMKASLKEITFTRWAIGRLDKKPPCTLEPEMDCTPLTGDPFCQTCYESDREADNGKG